MNDTEDKVYCPHCGEHFYTDALVDMKYMKGLDDQEFDMSCPECRETFHVIANVKVIYSSGEAE